MKETKKANERRLNSPLFHKVFKGDGIYIGTGNDTLDKGIWTEVSSLDVFDEKDVDSQYITSFHEKEKFDFVYSSHCLEHMKNPFGALREWWELVKYGGYLVFTVPDEDLYEKGVFPSVYNKDHKWTFTIFKWESRSSVSIDIIELLSSIDDCRIIKMELVDTNYNYVDSKEVDKSRGDAEVSIEIVLLKIKDDYERIR